MGKAAVRELLVQGQKVGVVTDRTEDISNLRALGDESRLYVTHGSPADRNILERVNLPGAEAVIVSTGDDATSMITVLTVRSLNEKIRIVVAVDRPELRDTLRTAGVTYVASPTDMGGRMCASAAFEPDVADALEDVTAADVGADIFEYVIRPDSPVAGKTFAEADALIRSSSGCILIALAHPDGRGEFHTVVNPPFDARLSPGDAIVMIGSLPNAERFQRWFGTEQGR